MDGESEKKVLSLLRAKIKEAILLRELNDGFPWLGECKYEHLETRVAVVFLMPFVYAFKQDDAANVDPDDTEVTPELKKVFLSFCEQARKAFPSYDEIVDEIVEICGSRIRSLCAMPDDEYSDVMGRLSSMNIQANIEDEELRILHSCAFDFFFAFLTVVGRCHKSNSEMEKAAWALNRVFDGFYNTAKTIFEGVSVDSSTVTYANEDNVHNELFRRISAEADGLYDYVLVPRLNLHVAHGDVVRQKALVGYWGSLSASTLFMTEVGIFRYGELFKGCALGKVIEESFEIRMGEKLKASASEIISRNAPRVPNESEARKRLTAEEMLELLLGSSRSAEHEAVVADIVRYLDRCFYEYARLMDILKAVSCAQGTPVVIDVPRNRKATDLFLRGLSEWSAKNYKTAIKTFESSAKFGHFTAASLAADAYLSGKEIPQDRLAAAAMFERNAKRGDKEAMLQVALFEIRGKEMPPNYKGAIKMATPLAEEGNVIAQNCMGKAYMQLAIAGNRNFFRESFLWFERASNKEFKEIHMGWVENDCNYDSWIKDPAETPEADAARAEATLMLGMMYEKGLYVAKDIEKARELYELSIERGNIQAKRALEKLERGNQRIDISWGGYFDYLWRSSGDFIQDYIYVKFPEARSHLGLSGATMTVVIAAHLAVQMQRDELIGANEACNRYGDVLDEADRAVENSITSILPPSLPVDTYKRMVNELKAKITPSMTRFMLDMYGDTPEFRIAAKHSQISNTVCGSLLRGCRFNMMSLGDASKEMNEHFLHCYTIYTKILAALS